MWACHGSSTDDVDTPIAAIPQAGNVDTRSEDIDALAVVGETCPVIVDVRCAYADSLKISELP